MGEHLARFFTSLVRIPERNFQDPHPAAALPPSPWEGEGVECSRLSLSKGKALIGSIKKSQPALGLRYMFGIIKNLTRLKG
ncbi:hypothetical protein [Butyrivibrio sp. AE3004]|uniref:hypothetical protein n=1 Tax=Butyrivibrio sp. AE3004 TaxID=1506994 RepID=UPI0018CC66E6|nr:hypothetical protein [Butyrivibrio sp. AE3004]